LDSDLGFFKNSYVWYSNLTDAISKDSSIVNSVFQGKMDLTDVWDSSVSSSKITNSEIHRSWIWDSSISDSILNEDTSVGNAFINNSWSNVYVLIVNPSTGEKLYVMEDDTLDLDTSSWTVNISNAIIWDSSFNNTIIRDSSLYRCYLQDTSLYGCTIYNTIFVNASADENSTIIMIDASQAVDSSIAYDTSTYYSRATKRLDVGKSGTSSDTIMSAGDYLNWVTNQGLWKKVGDMYIWTSAPDATETTNLITGFYAYNPHTFPISIEYMLFV